MPLIPTGIVDICKSPWGAGPCAPLGPGAAVCRQHV